jgi:hypothetical protein
MIAEFLSDIITPTHSSIKAFIGEVWPYLIAAVSFIQIGLLNPFADRYRRGLKLF